MALAGAGTVIVWNDMTPELRDEFFEWHPRQHMPERLSIPGFLRGRRCIAVDASVEFLTLYEVSGLEVLDSEIYRTRLANPTAWSLKVMPGFRNNVRGGCRVVFSQGQVMGGFMLSIRLETDDMRRSSLVDKLSRELMPKVSALPRTTGAHLCVNDPALSGGQVGARQGRFISQPDVVILIEGSTSDGVRAAAEDLFPDDQLIPRGANASVQRDLYQLEYSLQKLAGGTIDAPSPATHFSLSR